MLSKNALHVLETRYLKKDDNGKVCEKPEQMFMRVAKTVASAEKKLVPEKPDEEVANIANIFYKSMMDCDFLPNSPTLMNAGRDLGQLSACFVLPVGDSMEEIFGAIRDAALIHKSGGGTGFSFSRLRSMGSDVKSTKGVSSGPVSFMKVFNAATEAVKQGGTRRGANMGVLRVDHPDILDFIDCKKNQKDLTNFNISIGITEKFMEAALANEKYCLVDPHTQQVKKELNAKEVFDKIVHSAWANGEPGIIFLDRINKFSPVPTLGEVETTNPCGEQPLLPYESCNLGSINLSNFVNDAGKLDTKRMETTVKLAVQFLDNVITINQYPLKEIEKTTLLTRKIGLGVMGFADMLYKMGVPYNTQEARDIGEETMATIQRVAKAQSQRLGKERGSFPAYADSVFSNDKIKMRNATVTTIAPTGTISIIADTSSGVEPTFALAYIRKSMDTEMTVVNAVFKAALESENLYSEALIRKIIEAGSIAHMKEIPESIKRVFVTAHDISPEDHLKMQAAFQKSTDNAVSKTINFSDSATIKDVENAYLMAYKLDLKGVTIYRNGSRDEQVLNVGEQSKAAAIEQTDSIIPRDRPICTQGFTEKIKTGCGNLYITVNHDEKGICEVFTNLGRSGGCPSQSEATARLASTALRSGIDVKTIIEQLKGIRCHSTMRNGNEAKCLSCPDAIGKSLEKVFQKINNINKEDTKNETMAVCPECKQPGLEQEGGCNICRSCGYSKCQ